MMEVREVASLCAMNADGIGLQVRFTWRQDRYAHTVNVLVDNRSIPVFESVEGTGIDAWPPSPPLQQLSIEECHRQTPIALLIGMAGKSHWSSSVEPAADRAVIAFDVACRSRDGEGCIGSGYALLADGLTTDGDHGAVVRVEGRPIRIRCDREGDTGAVVKKDPLNVWIAPIAISSGGTTRWRYAMQLSEH